MTTITDLATLLRAIRDTLVNDTDLQTWSLANLGGNYIVYLGMDPESPPESTDTQPYIVVFGGGRSDRETATSAFLNYQVEIGFSIRNDTITTAGSDSVTYEGLLLIEEFRERAEDKLLGAKWGKIGLAGETLTDNYFPEFVSATQITVDLKQNTRRPIGRR